MALLPYEEVLWFLDREFVEQFAPHGEGFNRWRSVGAVVRPFCWRPQLRRKGGVNESVRPSTLPFFRVAAVFLDLLAVSHTMRIVPLAAVSDRIDGSARPGDSTSVRYQSWLAGGLGVLDECPSISPEALAEAQGPFATARVIAMGGWRRSLRGCRRHSPGTGGLLSVTRFWMSRCRLSDCICWMRGKLDASCADAPLRIWELMRRVIRKSATP